MVKLDFGAHIDGFISVVAHSLVVGASADNKVSSDGVNPLTIQTMLFVRPLGFCPVGKWLIAAHT